MIQFEDGSINPSHLTQIFFFMFIYYSFASIDEFIEACTVILETHKGGLGMFLELNKLFGLLLTAYITWFVNTYDEINKHLPE